MASCCNNVFYCVAGNIVSQPPGPAPVGFTGGPWATLDEANAGCSAAHPAVEWLTLSSACATGPAVQYPRYVYINTTNKTGWLAPWIHNSTRFDLGSAGLSSSVQQINIPILIPGWPACGIPGPIPLPPNLVVIFGATCGLSGDPWSQYIYVTILYQSTCSGLTTPPAIINFGAGFPSRTLPPNSRVFDFTVPEYLENIIIHSVNGDYSFDVTLSL